MLSLQSGKPAAKPAAAASGKVAKSELKKRARAVAYRKKAKAAKGIAKKPSAKKAAPAAGLAAPVSRFYSADDAATPLATRKKTVTAPLKVCSLFNLTVVLICRVVWASLFLL